MNADNLRPRIGRLLREQDGYRCPRTDGVRIDEGRLRALASRTFSYSTGDVINVAGGFSGSRQIQ